MDKNAIQVLKVIQALGEKIESLENQIQIKDFDIERLEHINANLRNKIDELENKTGEKYINE